MAFSQNRPCINRGSFVSLVAAAIVGTGASADARAAIVTFRDTGCSCCEGWVKAARDTGYAVTVHDLEHGAGLARFSLAEAMASCHTSVVGGYLVEGHMPLDVVARLLRERPKIRGIALPGMPVGVPGMGGTRQGKLAVLTLESTPRVYANI